MLIKVENEEKLFVCGGDPAKPPVPEVVNITVKVIDVNDPPEFVGNPAIVYQKEEEKEGKVLLKPTVKDVDSDLSNIRLVTPCQHIDGCFTFYYDLVNL